MFAEHLGPFRQCRHQLVAALWVTQRSDIQPHVTIVESALFEGCIVSCSVPGSVVRTTGMHALLG